MTQPTIKEKIQELLRQHSNVRTDINNVGMIIKEKFVNIGQDFPKEFARLICEEMTGKLSGWKCVNCFDPNSCDENTEEAYDQKVEEEKQKAQEILKALE